MEIKRTIAKSIIEHLSRPEITMIIGPRQVGKTTLIRELSDHLKTSGSKVVIMNLDFEDDYALLASQSKFLDYLKLNLGDNHGFVFVDEVQRKEDAGRFFKGIYDMRLPYKFILTGSGSVELKEKVSESLAGRKQIFEMRPISFLEFIDYKTEYLYTGKLDEYFSLDDSRLETLLEEYMHFGGYPRVILADTLERKRLEMQEIYISYLEKDIKQLLNIQKSDAFGKLLTILASQLGSLINVQELSNTLGIDVDTVGNYLWYMEKTFVTQICRPFYSNLRSELTKTPIYYFFDIGMRNFALNRFNNFDLMLEGGHLFENLVFNHLQEKYTYLSPTINYWRTKDGAEVDFVFKFGAKILPVEVKFKKLSKPEVSRSIHNYITKYKPEKFCVVNLTLDTTFKVDDCEITFINLAKFLYEDLGKLL